MGYTPYPGGMAGSEWGNGISAAGRQIPRLGWKGICVYERVACSETAMRPGAVVYTRGQAERIESAYALARLVGFAARSRSSRAAVRFFAATADAFLARSDLSSGVMFFAAVFPPLRPKLRDISVIAARTSAGIFIAIPELYT
jgi:hypothetical protein